MVKLDTERSSLTQLVQIAPEATPGTFATTTHRLQMTMLESQPQLETSTFRPTGQKFKALSILNKEHTQTSISGKGNYDELAFWLAGAASRGVVTTPPGGVLAQGHTFTPNSFGNNNGATYTIDQSTTEAGDRGHRSLYNTVTELSMSFSRDNVDVSGSMMGTDFNEGTAITLGSSPITMPLNPILPGDVSVYVDDDWASLGTTKLDRVVSIDFSLGSLAAPIWTVDNTFGSWVAPIETEPDVSLSMTMEADAQGMQFLDDIRETNTKFIRIHAESLNGEIEAGINREFIADFAIQITDTGGFSDSSGLFAIEWSMVGVHDPVEGKAFEFYLQNSTGAGGEWVMPALVSA